MPTFQTPEPITVTVEVPAGNVQVIASNRTDTFVEVRPTDSAKKADVRVAAQTTVDFAAGVLTVRTPNGWRTYSPLGGNPSIEVVVEVPTGSWLKATAGVGQLQATGEFGESVLEIAAGDIAVESPRGAVTAKAAKGDIRVGDASRGVLRLETSMGELAVGIRPGSAVRLETNAVSGTVQNLLAPVAGAAGAVETVQVYARNSFGNIIVRHDIAA